MQKRYYLDVIEEQHLEEEYPKESCITFYGEQSLESKIEELFRCLPSYPLCVQWTNFQNLEDLNGIEKEDMKNKSDEKENQGNQNYIDLWF